MTLIIRDFQDTDRADLIALWERCGLTRPWNDPDLDINQAITTQSSTILVGIVESELLASVMAGSDGHRGWVYYVAVDPDHRRKNWGRDLMRAAEQWLKDRGCRKMQLMIRDGNEEADRFYQALGYEPQAVKTVGKWFD